MVGMRGQINKNESIAYNHLDDGPVLISKEDTCEAHTLQGIPSLVFNACDGREIEDIYCQVKSSFVSSENSNIDAEIVEDFINTIETLITRRICSFV